MDRPCFCRCKMLFQLTHTTSKMGFSFEDLLSKMSISENFCKFAHIYWRNFLPTIYLLSTPYTTWKVWKYGPEKTPYWDTFHAVLVLSLDYRHFGNSILRLTLRKECPCSELFWSAFLFIGTEYEGIFFISPYSGRIRKNTDQNNSEYEHFSRSVKV